MKKAVFRKLQKVEEPTVVVEETKKPRGRRKKED